jgi:hypothetical protein
MGRKPLAIRHTGLLNVRMGFFDRLLGKSSSGKPPARAVNGTGAHPVSAPTPAPTPPPSPDPIAPIEETTPIDIGPVAPKLTEALELLEVRDIDGAKAIYEEVLASTSGDRPDVLVRISGDLGATGNVGSIVELIAQRYDAERHGPATGINLLQAYLALRNPEAAQHVLDLLFDLKKPELDERLWGFSNAIGELLASSRSSAAPKGAAAAINLVSISKPIWAYGIENVPGVLPSKPERLKRIAIGQLALIGVPDTEKLAESPEESLGRFTRGFPLWLAESLYFSAQYTTLAAIGLKEQTHYALFPFEWTTDNIRQVIDSSGSPIDYVITGALKEHDGDFSLVLRLWEIKGFRERKSFEANWTPSTADVELAKLHEQIRVFFEWKKADGLAYVPPVSPMAWIDSLGASLSTFLASKNVLPHAQLASLPPTLADPASGEAAALAHLTLSHRCARLEVDGPTAEVPDSALVAAARDALAQTE